MIDALLKNGTFPPLLLLYGEEDLLVEEAARSVFDASRAHDVAGMSTDVLDGDGQTLDAILSIARSYPMMSERRTLWVRRFEKVSIGRDRGERLSEYLAEPMPSTFILCTASVPTADGLGAAMTKNAASAQRKIKSLKAPFNILFAKAAWVEYPAMRSSQVAGWLRKRAEAKQLELSPHIAEYLVARHGGVLRELDMELDKLLSFLGPGSTVAESDVALVVAGTRTHTVFDLQRAIGQGNLALATTIINSMLATERQELLIVAMLVRYFLSLYKLLDVQGLRDRGAIAAAAGIPAFAVGDYLDAVQRIGPPAIERALSELRTAERLMKSTSIDARVLLHTVLMSVLTTAKAPSSGQVTVDIFAT